MEIIQGKKTSEMEQEEFRKIIAPYSSVNVEIGTGKGKFVYEMAKNHPKAFFIGVDADRNNLEKYSHKIYRKPERGGLPNALYVISNVEELPPELNNTANIIWVILPWGSLLQGLILARTSLLQNMMRISCAKGILNLYISYDVKYEPTKMENLGLPELTCELIDEKLAPMYSSEGITITERKILDNEALKEISSQWARQLAYGRKRKTFFIKAEINKELVQ
ncbi:MAG: hypothetical protein HXS46_02305 [Theionarchaea archaeon]|nr:hypothetical protein [Theionarchaea archaeon]